MITAGPDNTSVKIRSIRAAIVDARHLAIDGNAAALADATAQPLPAAFALGGDPAATLAAALDWFSIDGFVLAGLLRNQPWDTVPARSQPLSVPADAEMIIEGTLRPDDAAPLVLASATSGYYLDPSARRWTFEVSAITQRANPLLPLTVVGDLAGGVPQGEAAVLHEVRSRLLRPLLRGAVPELVDCSLPSVGGPSGFAVLAIRKSYPGQARRAAHAVWGLPPLERLRTIVVVDADIDVHDFGQVLGRVAANVAPDRDISSQTGPGDPLSHADGTPGLGSQLLIDATAKMPPEHSRVWPQPLVRPGELRDTVARRWAEYGLPPFSDP